MLLSKDDDVEMADTLGHRVEIVKPDEDETEGRVEIELLEIFTGVTEEIEAC